MRGGTVEVHLRHVRVEVADGEHGPLEEEESTIGRAGWPDDVRIIEEAEDVDIGVSALDLPENGVYGIGEEPGSVGVALAAALCGGDGDPGVVWEVGVWVAKAALKGGTPGFTGGGGDGTIGAKEAAFPAVKALDAGEGVGELSRGDDVEHLLAGEGVEAVAEVVGGDGPVRMFLKEKAEGVDGGLVATLDSDAELHGAPGGGVVGVERGGEELGERLGKGFAGAVGGDTGEAVADGDGAYTTVRL